MCQQLASNNYLPHHTVDSLDMQRSRIVWGGGADTLGLQNQFSMLTKCYNLRIGFLFKTVAPETVRSAIM